MKIKSYFYRCIMPVTQLYWYIFKPKTYGVKVLIINPNNTNQAALVLHEYGNRTLWNIPGGGYKPKRESAKSAAIREVFEELSVNLLNIKQIGEYVTDGEGKKDTVTIFSGTINTKDTLSPTSEIAEVCWRDINEISTSSNVARVARKAIECYSKM